MSIMTSHHQVIACPGHALEREVMPSDSVSQYHGPPAAAATGGGPEAAAPLDGTTSGNTALGQGTRQEKHDYEALAPGPSSLGAVSPSVASSNRGVRASGSHASSSSFCLRPPSVVGSSVSASVQTQSIRGIAGPRGTPAHSVASASGHGSVSGHGPAGFNVYHLPPRDAPTNGTMVSEPRDWHSVAPLWPMGAKMNVHDIETAIDNASPRPRPPLSSYSTRSSTDHDPQQQHHHPSPPPLLYVTGHQPPPSSLTNVSSSSWNRKTITAINIDINDDENDNQKTDDNINNSSGGPSQTPTTTSITQPTHTLHRRQRDIMTKIKALLGEVSAEARAGEGVLARGARAEPLRADRTRAAERLLREVRAETGHLERLLGLKAGVLSIEDVLALSLGIFYRPPEPQA